MSLAKLIWIVIFLMSWSTIMLPAVYAEEGMIKKGSISMWYSQSYSPSSRGESWGADGRTCGTGEIADFWFTTKYVNLSGTFAEVIHVDIEAELTTCDDPRTGEGQPRVPCDSNYFEVYINRGNDAPKIHQPVDPLPADHAKTLKDLLDNFSSLGNITNINMTNINMTNINMTNSTSLNATFPKITRTFSFDVGRSLSGATFAIRSRGACGRIFSMKMYYYYCNETFVNGIKYENTPSPDSGFKNATGYCSKASIKLNNATNFEARCYYNGTWSTDNTLECLCAEGYEPKNDKCMFCSSDKYKQNISNVACSPCPKDNEGNDTRTGCACKSYYYKPFGDIRQPISDCYALPKLDEKPTTNVTRNSVRIMWNVPNTDGLNDVIYYDVECYSCNNTNCDANSSCTSEQYDPGPKNFIKTSVVVSNLNYGDTYVFRVYLKNSLNKSINRSWEYEDTDPVTLSQSNGKPKPSDDNGIPLRYVIIGVVGLLLIILLLLLLIWLARRRKGKKNSNPASGYYNQGVELPNVGRRLYVDPTNYENPEEAVLDFTNELDPKLIFLQRLVGGGEFGDVYKGELETENKNIIPVAVKTLKHDADEKSSRDFLFEASVMGQFDNPNIVRMQGVVTKASPRMIVLEYMPNGSLENYLKSNDDMLTDLQLIDMARGVAAGMTYLAEIQFVHRDLAARNVLVNENLSCKIADFGLSRGLEMTETSSGEYSASGGKIPIRWTAPEAVLYRKFSSASDVWSFGILLWEIMSFAERPYWTWDNFKVLEEIDKGYRLPPPQNCPKGVHGLMLSCWKLERRERPSFEQITGVIDKWIGSPETMHDEIMIEPSSWIGKWLTSLKMNNYENLFVKAGYKTELEVFELSDEDLQTMGVTLIGHRNKIMKGINLLKLQSLTKRDSIAI